MSFQQFIIYLNKNSGALTFLITTVYVIATIAICLANIMSANASRRQLLEAKRQYEDEKKLKLMPCIQVKKIATAREVHGIISYTIQQKQASDTWVEESFLFEITNVGHDIARNVNYYWLDQVDDKINNRFRYHIESLPIGDRRVAQINFRTVPTNCHTTVILKIIFQDLIGNHYFQCLTFCFSVFRNKIELDTYAMKAPQELKEKVRGKDV